MTLKEILSANRDQVISYLNTNHTLAPLKFNMSSYAAYATTEWCEDIREASDVVAVINQSLEAFSDQYNLAAIEADTKAEAEYTAHIIGQDNRNAAAMASAFGTKVKKYAY